MCSLPVESAMSSIVFRVSFLLFVFLFPREAEMQAPVITAEPQGPLVVVEGQSLSLNWTYNLNGNNFLTIFTKAVGNTGEVTIAERLLSNPARIKPDFTGRITGNITDSFASVTFLAVNGSTDSGNYLFRIRNFANEAVPARVTITVLEHCQITDDTAFLKRFPVQVC